MTDRPKQAPDFEAALACALADTASPTGFAPVSGADQARAEAIHNWLIERGWQFTVDANHRRITPQ